jgi:hypothetical protein
MRKSIPTSIIAATLTVMCLALLTNADVPKHPLKAPQTLLSLYAESDVIYVGRFDKTVEGETLGRKGGYDTVSLKKYFDISSTLKGDNAKLYILEQHRYELSGRPADAADAPADAEVFDIGDSDDGLRSGDRVLIFLKFGQDGRSLKLTDSAEGIKKLSDDEIDTYGRRISELNDIFDRPGIPAERLVAWLVRCIEEPATRWEGAFLMIQSLERADWQRKQTVSPFDGAVKTGNAAVIDPRNIDPAILAGAIDNGTKQMLAEILIGESRSSERKRAVRGDLELTQIVLRWRDAETVSFMLSRLEGDHDSSYRSSELLRLIAEVFADEKINTMVDELNRLGPADASKEVKKAADARNLLVEKIVKRGRDLLSGQIFSQTAEK